MNYDHKKIKKQIQAESELYIKFGPGKIWSFILKEIFHNDTEGAKTFMLSAAGGFALPEVNRIVQQKKTHNKIYSSKSIS
jgi:hypothetical protein